MIRLLDSRTASRQRAVGTAFVLRQRWFISDVWSVLCLDFLLVRAKKLDKNRTRGRPTKKDVYRWRYTYSGLRRKVMKNSSWFISSPRSSHLTCVILTTLIIYHTVIFPASKLVFFSQIIPCLPSTDIWHCRNIGKKSNLRRSSSAITKAYCTSRIICTKLNGRWTFHGRLFAALQCMIFGWKSTSACQGYCDSIDGAILLSKVVFNNLRANVKNDITLICAKFGADVVNTSKFTSRKTKWPRFLALFVCQ